MDFREQNQQRYHEQYFVKIENRQDKKKLTNKRMKEIIKKREHNKYNKKRIMNSPAQQQVIPVRLKPNYRG